MDGQIVRLTAADFDEALDFLNLVYSMAVRPHDFQAMLPVMWARDDARMGRHLAIRRDGRIRAMLGVYPLPVAIGGRRLLFSTTGNVATHPYDGGKGYMSALLNAAMTELQRIGADASRLGGMRQRYNRYGFEPCGSLYRFTLTAHNLMRMPRDTSGITFRPLSETDHGALAFARTLFEREGIAVCREGDDGFFKTLCAWRNAPYVAYTAQGAPIGYLTAHDGGMGIDEQEAASPDAMLDMLAAWLTTNRLDHLSFTLSPWQHAEIAACQMLCESWSVSMPSSFCIRHWAEVTDALLALKAAGTTLPRGEVVLGIAGYGAIALSVTADGAHCEKTDQSPCLTLAPLDAARFLMGPLPPYCTSPLPPQSAALLGAWLPLPLSWNTLDRV